MLINDIRKGDIVRMKPFETDEDLKKFKNFLHRVLKQEGRDEYARKHLSQFVDSTGKKSDLKVVRITRTAKTQTEYAYVSVANYGIEFPIQARYLELKVRTAKHPVTKIFM
jgi:hypothetical protein